jgi:hypothetical protein
MIGFLNWLAEFVFWFGLGWLILQVLVNATNQHLEQKVERLDAEIEAIKKIYKRVKIEEYDGMFYVFDVETDEFLGQGRTAEEFADRLKHNLVLQPVEGDPDVIARFRKTIPQTDPS